uniref:Integrase catalytic domain-containing protein n=1 Tax=Haemonchus contortus TaxID=6289 RepID=A0A7I4YFT2_HAECO
MSTLGYGSDTYQVWHSRVGQFGFSLGIPPSPDTDGVHTTFDAEEEAAQRLWSLDSLGITDNHDPKADDELNARILNNFYRSSKFIDGFLYVQFPWKSSHPPLADNKQLAYCRLVSQYQRLRRTPSAWKQYIAAIEDHLRAGFIEEVDERVVNTHRVYYIPHQAVYKESSSTTKLRIVFDASSKVRGAVSLNDCIHQGPTLLPDLVGILLRIRLHRLLLIADVEKAFHQIRLQRSQRDVTRFLWLKDPFSPPSQDNLRIFRFTRIPFGINASPFMLAAAIQYYLRRLRSPLASEIERNTYVDNVALGAETTKQAVQKYYIAKSVFGDMHMNLRQFVCNSNLVNDTISKEDRVNAESETTLLGIAWNYHRDTLRMAVKTVDVEVHSKRTALRALASTYDPLGLLTPFLTNVKIFVQDLWAKQLAWDDPLDASDRQRWSELREELKSPLPTIPRLVVSRKATSVSFELCVFGDASRRVYACCAYLLCRSQSASSSRLVMAKSHLNDFKPITIPRSELLAVLISVRLAQYVVNQLDINISSIYVFSDSQIALHWIHSSRQFKTFVQNRVKAIKDIVASFRQRNITTKFYYVASQDNPADCATRGLSTKDSQGHIWWSGPSFLRLPPSQWPTKSDFSLPPGSEKDCGSEYQAAHIAHTSNFVSVLPFCRTNSLKKLLRITAYVLRFLRSRIFDRISSSSQKRLQHLIPQVAQSNIKGSLTAVEMTAAETLLILAHYREDEHILQRLPLHKFNVQKDHLGLLRCPIRVGQVTSAPVLIIPSHRLATILVWHHHLQCYHAGVYSTIAALRANYFIPSIRSLVAKTLRTCVVCRKVSGHAYRYPEMPTLPEERTTRSRPFQYVGIDYLGPLSYRSVYFSANKIWVCLITCMATRAVHLELVVNNTVQEFLLAFRRFIARRGTPDIIYSDNATTFHAADDALSNVVYATGSWRQVADFSANHKITWRFITPLSPWKGGFYERMVQLFKSAFRKAVGRTLLMYEEFQTVVAEIEAVINSRPITPFRGAESSVSALRPIDFISPQVSLQIPPSDHLQSESAATAHKLGLWYKESLKVLDHFWHLWHTDYLTALKERHQLRIRQPKYVAAPLNINDVVIIADEKLPRSHWPLGLVVKIHSGSDGEMHVSIRFAQAAERSNTAAAAENATHSSRKDVPQVHPKLIVMYYVHFVRYSTEEQQGQLEQYPGTPHPPFEQRDQAQSSQQQQRERRPSSTSQSRTASPQSRASAPPPAQAAGAQPEAQLQQRARESPARPQAPPTEEYGRVEEVEQRPHVAQPLYPAGEPSTTRCFLCGNLHYTSSCRNYPSLKQRIKINAERGGCFKCGAVHREEHCASTLKCKGCQSEHHHTAFCAYNKNVIRDLDELEYGNYLKDAKAYAQYVRDKRRML